MDRISGMEMVLMKLKWRTRPIEDVEVGDNSIKLGKGTYRIEVKTPDIVFEWHCPKCGQDNVTLYSLPIACEMCGWSLLSDWYELGAKTAKEVKFDGGAV